MTCHLLTLHARQRSSTNRQYAFTEKRRRRFTACINSKPLNTKWKLRCNTQKRRPEVCVQISETGGGSRWVHFQNPLRSGSPTAADVAADGVRVAGSAPAVVAQQRHLPSRGSTRVASAKAH